MPATLQRRRRSTRRRHRLTPERLRGACQVVLLRSLWAERDALVEQYEPMLTHIWGKLKSLPTVKKLGFDDARQVGFQWLCHCALRYDPKTGPFMTYAFRSVRAQIVNVAAKQAAGVHVPTHLFWDALRDEGPGREAFEVEVLSPRFETPARQEEESWADDEAVAAAVEKLPERDRLAVRLYYWENQTLAQVGEVLGLTRERVRQILLAARARLRPLLEGAMT